jgi:hypothetical protein
LRLAVSIFVAVAALVTVLLVHGEGWPVLIAFAWPAATGVAVWRGWGG